MERFKVVCKRCGSSNTTIGILDISESSSGESIWVIVSASCRECDEVECIEYKFETENMPIIHS